jgi:hypothetical protein
LNVAAGQTSSSKRDSGSRWLRGSTICVASALAVFVAACSSGGELPGRSADVPPADVDPATIRLPFLVEDYFVPNGCFGDSDCAGDTIHIDSRGCGEPPTKLQGGCRVYSYKPLAAGTAGYLGYLGILFQGVGPGGESQIGKVPGVSVQAGAKRVVFWTKAIAASGSVDVGFRAGGANNWEGETNPALPYKDGFGVPEHVTLTDEYRQVSIDLSQVTYTTVVSPFGWSIETNGSTDSVDLFIGDLRWE